MTTNFHALTDTAHSILTGHLQDHGNTLSPRHRQALLELVGTMTAFVSGDIRGRVAFPLATGLGKTSGIIAWVTALHRRGLAGKVSVSVAASQVQSLCSIKQALLAYGVPDGLIGLRHSYQAGSHHGVTLSSTGDSDRPIMLVTHSRVRGGKERELFTLHQGKPRDLIIYDETLFKADAFALRESAIGWQLGGLERTCKSPEYHGVLDYLDLALREVTETLAAVRAGTHNGMLDLPALAPETVTEYTRLIERYRESTELLVEFLTLSQESLRAVPLAGNDGIIHHVVAVPEELRNVLVLDASYPIRKLVHGGGVLESGSYAKDVKRFDNVTIYRMPYSGSRTSLTEAFAPTAAHQRSIAREVIEVIKTIPADEPVLVFTFKGRGKKAPDMARLLLDDLRAASIDPDSVTPEGRKRIEVVTWGNETGLNSYAHCRNVVLMGILHKSLLDIAAAYAGEREDHRADLREKDLYDLLHHEVAHYVYQALSRGSCRQVDNGQARPMKAWIIHKRDNLKDILDKVMPGAMWLPWTPKHLHIPSGKIAETAAKIAEYLRGLPESVRKVSTSTVKKALALNSVPSMTFTEAARTVTEKATEWRLHGRSLVKADAASYGFSVED